MNAFGLAAQRAAQKECVNGHPFDEANTKIRANGCRACRACGRDRAKAKRVAAAQTRSVDNDAQKAAQLAAVTRLCPECDTTFLVRFRSAPQTYCSRSCAASVRQRRRVKDTNSNWRGGKSFHPLYDSYMDMLGRTGRPTHARYADYGGRGITVCDRWRADFWHFVADMGERPAGHSIDRIDNDRGYSPENCRWASRSQQSRNRRPLPPRDRDQQTGQFLPGGAS